jgi:hypothetical protein
MGHLAFCDSNPCDPNPEMLCTVTGAAGTIDWLGQQWVLPGDSGEEKSVCPTNYLKIKSTYTYPGYPPPAVYGPIRYAIHNWVHDVNSGNRLSLDREYNAGPFTYAGAPSNLNNRVNLWAQGGNNFNALRVNGDADSKHFINFFSPAPFPVPITYTYVYATTINKILGETPGYYNDYNLKPAWFGSHTIAGITYAWAKGAGW